MIEIILFIFFTCPDNAILIMVFNAAGTCPTMIGMFGARTKSHYIYLKDSFDNIVPTIDALLDRKDESREEKENSIRVQVTTGNNFFLTIFDRLRHLVAKEKECPVQVQIKILDSTIW